MVICSKPSFWKVNGRIGKLNTRNIGALCSRLNPKPCLTTNLDV